MSGYFQLRSYENDIVVAHKEVARQATCTAYIVLRQAKKGNMVVQKPRDPTTRGLNGKCKEIKEVEHRNCWKKSLICDKCG